MTNYPNRIDTNVELPTVIDNTTPIQGSNLNSLRDAVIAVESELGIKPSGTNTTVKNRLDALEASLAAVVASSGTFAAGGDLSGTGSNQTVIGLQTRPVASTAPNTNDVLTWSGSSWAPSPAPSGFSAAGDLSGTPTNQRVVGLQGIRLDNTTPNVGDAFIYNGSFLTPAATFFASHDLSGNRTSQTVIGLQGRSLLSTAPNSGDVVTWNGSAWAPAPSAGGGATAVLPCSIYFTTGDSTTSSSIPIRIGAREIDMSLFPATIGILNRTIKFIAIIEASTGSAVTSIRLQDVTNNVTISSTTTTTSSTTLVIFTSSALTVGSAAGNIRNDAITLYEVQLSMTSGNISTDRAICASGRIEITYA